MAELYQDRLQADQIWEFMACIARTMQNKSRKNIRAGTCQTYKGSCWVWDPQKVAGDDPVVANGSNRIPCWIRPVVKSSMWHCYGAWDPQHAEKPHSVTGTFLDLFSETGHQQLVNKSVWLIYKPSINQSRFWECNPRRHLSQKMLNILWIQLCDCEDLVLVFVVRDVDP